MAGADTFSSASQTILCGACQGANAPNAQFCKGCGHALYESCPGCSAPALLDQAFCGGCGHDLKKVLADQQKKFESWLAEAIELAKQQNYDRAKTYLERVSTVGDYRHRDWVDKAKAALGKIEAIAEREVGMAGARIERATEAHKLGDHAAVIELLDGVSENLLTAEARSMLSKAKTFRSELTRLESDAQQAISQKNWLLAGPLLDQLLTLIPEHPDYTKLAIGIAKKLMKAGQKLSDGHQYDDALLTLDSVPELGQDESYKALRKMIEHLKWISSQFSGAPFATPMLGRLAVRWTKDAPNDQGAAQWVQRLSRELREAPRKGANLFPELITDPKSWCGGSLGLLAWPQCVDGMDINELRGSGGRMNVALGLALQGLGRGRLKENFVPKKGVFADLKNRKKKTCWGIDIGSSGVRAICLELVEEQPTVVDCFIDEFDEPLCRRGAERDETQIVGQSVAKFIDEKDLSQSTVWVNMPANHLVSRFVRLPPLPDKTAQQHLENEIKQRIPIEFDELVAVRWIAPLNEETVHGRPAVVVAAKQQVVENRLEMLKAFGLTITGMQGDALSLVNLATCEFREQINIQDEEPEGKKSKKKSKEQEEESHAFNADAADAPTPTVAILDCGAQKTTLVLVSSEAHWFWTVENGSEDITSLLAGATKSTHQAAEKLKRNVADLSYPATQYGTTENRLDETRSRLRMLLSDALSQNKRFDVIETWCSGGGVLVHQYLRRVMLSDISS